MPDLVRYLDKNPLHSFTLGPSGLGIAQTGFNDVWHSWYEEDVGITFVKESDYNHDNPTGYHASGSQDILFAKSVSTTFDSGAYLWASIHNFNSVNVFRYSGAGYTTQASFTGQYPQIFYNVANNLPERRYVHCFYLKSGENKIYSRSNEDNFASEIVFHQDFEQQVVQLKYVSRFDEHPNKITIMGLYENGNAFQLVSDCFYLFETGIFMNFSSFPVGAITNLNDWECLPAANFTEQFYQTSEDFALYPTGVSGNLSFPSGTNMSGGFTWQSLA